MHVAVAELYRVFQPYRLAKDFNGCPHCVAAEESTCLAKIPLRELTVADLDRYAFKAMTTWGTERDSKHFLPRLMELLFEDLLAFDFPETLLGKLAYAKWQSWPDVEREAVATYLEALWQEQLQVPLTSIHDDRIETALGGLAAAYESVNPFLATWGRMQTATAAHHLARLIDHSADDIMTKDKVVLWGEPEVASREIIAFIRSGEAATLLEAQREHLGEWFPFLFEQLEGIRAAAAN